MPEADEPEISIRADAIAKGLIATKRAAGAVSIDRGMLRIVCRQGGYYWIARDGHRVLRGKTFVDVDELQPTFGAAMERTGREVSSRHLRRHPMRSVWPT